jgi:uncharacterized protein (DUF2147 family)
LFIFILAIYGCGSGGDSSSASNILLGKSTPTGTIQGKLSGPNKSGVIVLAERVENGKTASVTQYTSPTKNKKASAPIYSALTNSDGNFSIENVPEGSYFIQAKNGNTTVGQKMNVSVRSYAVTNLNIAVTPTANVKGRVLINSTDTNNAVVYLSGTSYVSITDNNGYFTISNVPVGSYNMVVSCNGPFDDTLLNSVEVTAPTTTIPDITVIKSNNKGYINGKVIDNKGNSIYNATVTLSGATNEVTQTDNEGNFDFPNLPFGNYQLKATISGMNTMIMPSLNIDDGNYSDEGIMLILTPQGTPKGNINGHIFDPYNGAISGASVSLYFNDMQISNTSTDTNGYYTFNSIDEGVYTLRVSANNYEEVRNIVANVAANQTQTIQDIILKPFLTASLTGKIEIGLTGNPASSINVNLLDNNSSVVKTSLTDTNGTYNFSNIAPGQYYISVTSNGNVPIYKAIAVGPVPIINVETLYIRPMLSSLSIEKDKFNLSFNKTIQLNNNNIIAHYLDGTQRPVIPTSWQIESGSGSINGDIYTAPSVTSIDYIKAVYVENGFSISYSYFYNIYF